MDVSVGQTYNHTLYGYATIKNIEKDFMRIHVVNKNKMYLINVEYSVKVKKMKFLTKLKVLKLWREAKT